MNRKYMNGGNKVKTCFFNKINKCDKLLPTLIIRKRRDRLTIPSAGEDGAVIGASGFTVGTAQLLCGAGHHFSCRRTWTYHMTQQSIPGCVPKRDKNVYSLRGLHTCL